MLLFFYWLYGHTNRILFVCTCWLLCNFHTLWFGSLPFSFWSFIPRSLFFLVQVPAALFLLFILMHVAKCWPLPPSFVYLLGEAFYAAWEHCGLQRLDCQFGDRLGLHRGVFTLYIQGVSQKSQPKVFKFISLNH